MVVDTNGNTNIFTGVVERDGDFWIENLSLDGGTNELTLIATDAAGNVAMTNITLYQSAIGLTINPPDSSQFWNPTMTIYGTISDSSDYTVWVNGVKATLNGTSWEADNVPNTPGGTAVFQARAIPNSDNGGNGTGGGGNSASYENPGNPDSAQAQDADSQTDKPERLFVSSSKVSYTWHWRLYHAYYDGNMQLIGTNLNDYHEEYQPQWDWKDGSDGSGGSGDWTSEWSGSDGNSSEETIVSWPKTFWPDLEWGTEEISVNGGDPEEGWVDEPAIVEEHCEVKNPSPQDDDVWILNGNEWDETKDHWDYARHAQTHMKLFTGGKGKPQRQNLFVVNGSANEVLNQWARPYRDDLTEFIYWDPEAGGPDIPKQDITIGELGQLGSDGNLYVLLPDNVTKDVTPKVKGVDFYTYTVSGAKYRLFIQANFSILQADRVVATANFIVGQDVNFSPAWSPGTPPYVDSIQHWNLPGNFKNASTTPCDTCSDNPYVNSDLLANQATSAWWVSGGTPKTYTASIGMNLHFSNGQDVSIATLGQFHMWRPQAKISPSTTSVGVYFGNLLTFAEPPTDGITFYHTITIPAGFSGSTIWVQVDSNPVRQLQDSSSTWHIFTEKNSGPYLDTADPYPPEDFVGTDPVDSPGLQLPSSYLRGGAADTMEMWMMFQPVGGHRVPLRAVNWFWNGSATNGPSGWGFSNGDNSHNPTDFETETYPTWNDNVLDAQYEP